jgi:SAM-dependent methyltransferase
METARAVRSYPEYAEYFVPYAVKRSLYSLHYYLSRLVGTGQRVLDVSLSNDLERGLGELTGNSARSFDRILLLDILEHLRNPSPVLRDSRRLLAQRGKLIVSVPNAVNLTVRLKVLFGRFRYDDRGILDWSHLRFFTKKTIRALLEEHGYRITSCHFTVMPLERLIPLRPENRLLRFANRVLRVATAVAPGLLAYEILLVAER